MAAGSDRAVIGSIALRTGVALCSDQAWLMLPAVPEKGEIFIFFAFGYHSLNKTEFR